MITPQNTYPLILYSSMLFNDTPKILKILLSDPYPQSRDNLMNVLNKNGHEVDICESNAALASFESYSNYSAIIIDISTAAQNDLDTLKQLQLRGVNIPIVGITSHFTYELESKAKKVGMYALLGKPTLPERLIYTITSAIEKRNTPSHTHAKLDPKAVMLQTRELAVKSAKTYGGRAFGAILADSDGNIITEGQAPDKSNKDPLNFAESTAIRTACQKLNTMDLSPYTMFCSFEPTNLGKALIKHVHIPTVYYSLSSDDIKTNPNNITPAPSNLAASPKQTHFHQIFLDEAKRICSITD